RVHPAVRELVRRVRDGLRADQRDRPAARADRDRQRPDRQRALESPRRPGARLRDVRRPGGNDGDLRAASAPDVEVGEVRRFSLSAWTWILLGSAYFFIPLIATFLFSIKDNRTGNCCSLGNYGTIIHDPEFWTTFKLSIILALETIAI